MEIQTDKTTVEIPSPAAGVVSRILVSEGEVVPVGTVLVVIGADGAEPTAPTPSETVSQGASEYVRRRSSKRLARELGVDLDSVTATGPQGRVTEEDVRRAATSTDQVPGGPPRAVARSSPGDRRAHDARAP